MTKHLYEHGGLAMCHSPKGYTVYHPQSGRDLATLPTDHQAYSLLHDLMPVLDWTRPWHQGWPWETAEPIRLIVAKNKEAQHA